MTDVIEIIRRAYNQVRDDRNMPYRERIAVTLTLKAILEELTPCSTPSPTADDTN